MAWWVIPAMVASTAVTVMGIQQQKKQMKANAAWKDYERQLNYHYEKGKRLTDQKKLMSEQRAAVGASGAQLFTGSNLLVAAEDMNEFENDMWFLEKGVALAKGTADSQLKGAITSANYQIGSTLLNSAASVGSYQADANFAKKFGTGTTGTGSTTATTGKV